MSTDQNSTLSAEEWQKLQDELYAGSDNDDLYSRTGPDAETTERMATFYKAPPPSKKPESIPSVVTNIQAVEKEEDTAALIIPVQKKKKTRRKALKGQLSLSFEPPQPDIVTPAEIPEMAVDDSGNDEENLDNIFLTGNPQFGETEKELQRKLAESTALTKQMQEPLQNSTMDNVAGNMINNYTPQKRNPYPHRKIAEGTQTLYATPSLTYYVHPKNS